MGWAEKRTHQRYHDLSIKYEMNIDEHRYFGEIDNISLSGCFLATIDQPIEEDKIDTTHTLALKNSNTLQAVKIQSKIVHISMAGIGINFICTTASDKKVIRSFMNEYINNLVKEDQNNFQELDNPDYYDDLDSYNALDNDSF